VAGWLLAIALFVLLAAPSPASAAPTHTFTVRNAGDAGDAKPGNGKCATAGGKCTLRAAIEEANALAGRDTIMVRKLKISLGSQLAISSSMEIVGAGAKRTIVDGSSAIHRVFLVNGGPVTLRGLTVRGGDAQVGGGLYIDTGSTVEISDARVVNNHAFTGGGGLLVGTGATVEVRRTTIQANDAIGAFGGGVYNFGTLLVRESLIAENDSNRTGGIYSAPGSVLVLSNTTVSGNTAHSPQAGTGGLVNAGYAFLGNVTVTENGGVGNNVGSFLGGGLLSTAGATTVVKNSIIAGNHGRGGPDDCVGALSLDSRYVLIGSTTGCQLPAATGTFVLNRSAQLGPLSGNGGPTRTHLPASTSPAIDAGYPFPPGHSLFASDHCQSTDQRGVPRLICDLGAVEREVAIPTQLLVTTTADQVDALPGNAACATANGACSLRAAVQEANRLPGRQTIIVPAGVYGLSISPVNEAGFDPAAGGDLDLLDAVTVMGAGPTSVVVDGNHISRLFDVAPGVEASISGATIRDGTDLGGGGLRVTSGSLTLGNTIVDGNESSSGAGGGIEVDCCDSVLHVMGSVISNNRAPSLGGDGGGIDVLAVGATISDSRITGNKASGAGGGLSVSGAVTVTRSTIANNQASFWGGGISAGVLELVRSTVSGNSAGAQGGGVFASGAIVNSTISGNTSATNGGGVSTGGSLSLLHVTVARNIAAAGGNGLHSFGSVFALSLRNTILADPPGHECAGLPPSSGGHNIASDASCSLTAGGDRQATNALLGPLANNGGPTQTHLPSLASPAIDAGANAGVTIDQRGVSRPQGSAPDIGAVERQ
jgi:CSLREA domain-containing protein